MMMMGINYLLRLNRAEKRLPRQQLVSILEVNILMLEACAQADALNFGDWGIWLTQFRWKL